MFLSNDTAFCSQTVVPGRGPANALARHRMLHVGGRAVALRRAKGPTFRMDEAAVPAGPSGRT
eukprot:11741317-Alexandrium_andersonii.AAC.1